jgi:hypothetical protein
LAAGFHKFSIAELDELCVTAFPYSGVRSDIMAGFKVIHERALTLRIEGEIWIDGSFLTKKIDPQDIDFVFVVDAALYEDGTQEQNEFLEWLISNEDDPKKSFLCHTDVVLVYPPDSPLYPLTVNTKRHWEENVYGYSVATREPKGIVVVTMEQTKVSEESVSDEAAS